MDAKQKYYTDYLKEKSKGRLPVLAVQIEKVPVKDTIIIVINKPLEKMKRVVKTKTINGLGIVAIAKNWLNRQQTLIYINPEMMNCGAKYI